MAVIDLQNATINIFNHGWICPKCGRVFSPLTSQCEHCNKKIEEKPDDK